jgi:hypothetical protein
MELFLCCGNIPLALNQWRSQMAKDRERTRPGGEERHSVLEGPEYIAGVPGTKNEDAKVASRNPEECESVLDGPTGREDPKATQLWQSEGPIGPQSNSNWGRV